MRISLVMLLISCSAAAQTPPDARTTLARVVRAMNDKDWKALDPLVDKDADVRYPTGIGGTIFSLTKGPANPASVPTPWPRYSLLVRRIRILAANEVLLDGAWSRIDPDTHVPGVEGSFVATVRGQALTMLRLYPSPPAPLDTPLKPAPPFQGTVWVPLFDGKTTDGWQASGGGPFPQEIWTVNDGCLMTLPPKRPGPRYSIQTTRLFLDFEFEFEWKIVAGANSGVKYRVLVSRQFPTGAYDVASEFQLADDAGDPGARVDPETTIRRAVQHRGAAEPTAARPPGEWNQSRLLVRGHHVEHWLNGEKVVEYETDEPFASPIVLQHHVTEARFRNLRVRALDAR